MGRVARAFKPFAVKKGSVRLAKDTRDLDQIWSRLGNCAIRHASSLQYSTRIPLTARMKAKGHTSHSWQSICHIKYSAHRRRRRRRMRAIVLLFPESRTSTSLNGESVVLASASSKGSKPMWSELGAFEMKFQSSASISHPSGLCCTPIS